ncbi:MAG TPA: glycosyltransferase family 4 protein [Methylomirabilota bacterium]|nr:glycosyltransferase family 4 protein [Methylomirabilota bacterium]
MTRDRRPRALLLVENLPIPLDRRVWQEARALHGAGWDVTIISPRGAGEMGRIRERVDGICLLRYPQRPARGLAGYLFEYGPSMLFTAALTLYARTHGPFDVVHGCNPPDLFWLFGVVARRQGGVYVFDQHDVGPELASTKWGRHGVRAAVLGRVTRWLEARSYRTAALVLAPNDSYRDIAIQRGGVPSDRVLIVRNAPDVARYRALAAGIEPDPHRVGYVGVMGSQDGLDVLLDAWALVTAEPDMADAVLELVGDGEARPRLEAQADHLGLARRVRFHGYQRAETFVPTLARCAVGVSPDPPTAFNEVSTMVKVVDYLAVGRGVVAFDLAETRRLAGDAVVAAATATARGLADALLSVMRDPAQGRALGAAGTDRLTEIRLDWSHSAAVLVEGYARVLGRTPPPR